MIVGPKTKLSVFYRRPWHEFALVLAAHHARHWTAPEEPLIGVQMKINIRMSNIRRNSYNSITLPAMLILSSIRGPSEFGFLRARASYSALLGEPRHEICAAGVVVDFSFEGVNMRIRSVGRFRLEHSRGISKYRYDNPRFASFE